jgi:broad specificity phosphatase PhoE
MAAMGTLYLIRHGQASYGQADYDRLSPTGHAQARALGERLDLAGLTKLDAIYSGPMTRQRETLAGMRAAAAATGHALPGDDGHCAELAEYPAFELLAAVMPKLIAEEPALAPIMAGHGDPALLDRAFWLMITRWSKGELTADGVETIVDFSTRIRRGLETLMAAHPGGRVGVVTSGGAIGMAILCALEITGERAIAIGRHIRNASVSEFRFRSKGFAWAPEDFSLIAFNHVAHLPPDLHTFR